MVNLFAILSPEDIPIMSLVRVQCISASTVASVHTVNFFTMPQSVQVQSGGFHVLLVPLTDLRREGCA